MMLREKKMKVVLRCNLNRDFSFARIYEIASLRIHDKFYASLIRPIIRSDKVIRIIFRVASFATFSSITKYKICNIYNINTVIVKQLINSSNN